MGAERILFVEDDPGMTELVRMWLERAGYAEIEHAGTGGQALEAAAQRPPACVILDVGLPDQSGLEVCRMLRARPDSARLPVILFTAHKRDKLNGLQCGADYFVGKSSDPTELLATLEAAFRKRRIEERVLIKGDVALKLDERAVAWQGTVTPPLTPKAFSLLHVLVERGPQPVSRDDLYRLVEGVENPGLSRALDVLLNRLRKSLPEELAARIVAVKNFGYCFLDGVPARVTRV